VLFWLASRRGLLRGKVESGEVFGAHAEGLTVQEKIKILVLERLRMNGDVKDVWQDVGHPFPLISYPSYSYSCSNC
jgi:ubiquinone biosynthesis protein COQ9